MRLLTASEDTAVASETQVQLTLSRSETEELRHTLPWLVRALADRPETPPRHRVRRQRARALLERLLNVLPPEVAPADAPSNDHRG
jgi:hypothetical protein